LHLVDLAGSEKIYKYETNQTTIKESKNINLSLLNLTKVILSLEQKAKQNSIHVPYRDSVLTMFLKSCFETGSAVSMIFTINFDKDHLEESISTLKFAMRCRNIKITQKSLEKTTKGIGVSENAAKKIDMLNK